MKASFDEDKGKEIPRNYPVPNFGIDSDIINVSQAIKGSEKKLNLKFTADFGKEKAPVNPRDYEVPDFGLDHEIKDSESNLKNAQTTLKHVWTPKQDENGYWTGMPAAADNGSYAYNPN